MTKITGANVLLEFHHVANFRTDSFLGCRDMIGKKENVMGGFDGRGAARMSSSHSFLFLRI